MSTAVEESPAEEHPPGLRSTEQGRPGALSQLIDQFIPATLRGSREHARRGRLIVGTSLTLLLMLLVLIVRRLTFDEPHAPTLLMMAAGALLIGLTPVVLRVTASFAAAGWSLLLVGVALICAGSYVNGGFDSLAVYWYPALPLLASFMVGPRLALVTSGLLVADLVALYLLHRAGHDFPQPVTGERYQDFFVVGAILAVAFSAVLGAIYEAAWKRAEAALDASEERYALAVQGAREVLWDWDSRTGSLYVSPRLARILELSASPATVDELRALIHPDDLPEAEAAVRRCYGGDTDLVDAELRLRSSRGTWRWFDARGQAIRHGAVVRLAGSLRDVTRSKDVERELAHKVGELERAGRALAQFTRATSHELREPLRSVTSFAQLVEQRAGYRLEPKHREYLRTIVGGAHRMDALVRDLHAHARLAEDHEPPVPTCMGRAVAAALEALRESITAARAEVRHADLPTVWCAPGQLETVFEHLLSNAIKFRGESPPVMDIRASVEHDMVHVTVQDNGIGIAREHATRVFELFQRLHPRDRYPGTGSGLAVCRNIIERAGGRIWVESEPGRGATFHFTLRPA